MIKSKSKVSLWIVCTCILAFGCIERLDFRREYIEGQLVIYGLITDGEETPNVTVSRTRTSSFLPEGIHDAIVNLIQEDGTKRLFEYAGIGKYELPGFKAELGKGYKLEVKIGEQTYESQIETMPTISGNDELRYEIGIEPYDGPIERPVLTTYTKTTLPQTDEPIYLRWKVMETSLWGLVWIIPESGLPPPQPPPCFIYDEVDPNRLKLYDGAFSNNRSTELILGKRRVDNTFIWPYYQSVTQLSINQGAYEYWQQLKIMLDNQGSLFDIPSATVKGNIYNTENPDEKVLGYFEVAKTKTTRFYTLYSDMPFYLNRPCDYIRGKREDEYLPECIRCEARAGSRRWTSDRPSWWFSD